MNNNEFMKKDEVQIAQESENKLFANKKANIAIMVAFGIVLAIIVGLAIWVKM